MCSTTILAGTPSTSFNSLISTSVDNSLNIFLPSWKMVMVTIVRCPDRLSHKEPHCLDVVVTIQREAVIHSCRQNNHASFLHCYTDPLIIFVPHVKVSTTLKTIAYLFIGMQVFFKEIL
uniref:Uncharacterized protein n=1 Tax=Arundo donax TaxID=35708 RepID=A0A0A8XMZ9_ARUDO